jgi:hypothetical protein
MVGRKRAHAFACHLLAAGTPVTYLAAQMDGHASPATTLTWYARWIPTGDRRWVETLQAIRLGRRADNPLQFRRARICHMLAHAH